MDTTPTQVPSFIFRGNAVAASGYLTKLDNQPIELNPDTVTVHGESSLPVIGGVSRSRIDKPVLPYPEWISYDTCETFAEGSSAGDTTVTTVRASVNNVRVMTRPSPEDYAPGVQSITFRADRLAIGVRSVYRYQSEPVFELAEPELGTMSLTRTSIDGPAAVLPLRLEFDVDLMGLGTLSALDNAFLGDQDFFNAQAPRYAGSSDDELVFSESRMPRSEHGYVITSIVKRIVLGDRIIEGNVLAEPGFGTIQFGVMLVNGYNRRISLAVVRTGSDPAGSSNFSGVDPNGIYGSRGGGG